MRGRSRCETVCNMLSQTRQCAGAAGKAVEGVQRRQIRLERAHELAPEQTAKRVEHQIVHITQAVRAAKQEKQPRELPELDKRRKRQRHERDAAEIQTADVTQVHPERQEHQDVAHDLLHRAVEQRRQIRARIGEHERRLAQEIGHELKRHELRVIGRELRRLRSVRQRKKHERQHTQNIKQKQAAEQLKQRARICRQKNGTATGAASSGNAHTASRILLKTLTIMSASHGSAPAPGF